MGAAAPAFATDLERTVGGVDADACEAALEAAMTLYADSRVADGEGSAGLREFAPVSLAGELGYGLLLGRSLLTLGATHDRDSRGARETFGLTWEPRESRGGGGLSFRLGYERSTAAEHGPRLDLTYFARF